MQNLTQIHIIIFNHGRTGSEDEMNVVLNEMEADRSDAVERPKKRAKKNDDNDKDMEKDDDVEPPKKKAKKSDGKENTPRLNTKQKQNNKKGKQQKQKRGEKVKGSIIVVGAEDKAEQQKTSDPPLPPPVPPKLTDKQNSSAHGPSLPLPIPLPPTHPPPSHSQIMETSLLAESSFSSISSLPHSIDDKEPLHTSHENDISDSGEQC